MTVDLDRLDHLLDRYILEHPFSTMRDLITELRAARLAALEQTVVTDEVTRLRRLEKIARNYVKHASLPGVSSPYVPENGLYGHCSPWSELRAALQVRASSAKTADDSASGGQRVEAPAWTGGCSLCPARFSTAWELEQHEKEHLQTDASAYAKYVADQALENAAQRVFNNGVRVGAEEMKRRCGEAILSCPDGEHVVNIYHIIRALPLDPQS